MEITQMDKLKAMTFMHVLFADQNSMNMCGLGGSGLASVRMSREVLKFQKYVDQNRDRVQCAYIYKSTYFQESRFVKRPENILLSYENGIWTDKRTQNPTQFGGKKSGDDF